MDPDIRLRRLRRQRNIAGACAIFLVLGSFGLALPRSMARYREWRTIRAELVDLQRRITAVQGLIVDEQRRIIELQQQIVVLREQER